MTTPVSPLLRRLLASLVVVLCLGVGSVLRADEPAKSFDIPTGDAAAALKKFSEQSGNQVIFPEDAVAGAVTSELKGDYAPAEAMTHLLAGSGLKSHRDAKSGSFAVTRQANLQPDLDPNVSRAIAQDSVRPAKNPRTEENTNGEKVINLDTFEVFGQKTLNMDIARTEHDPQAYHILTAAEIDRSGAANIEDFLRARLSMTAQFRPSSRGYGIITGNTSSVNLRALGANETLILVDGRRMSGVISFGGNAPGQPDLNEIPLNSIERIEVLPTSASAIYGGAALGGVVNIVLKKRYTGGEIRYSYDAPMNSSSYRSTVSFTSGAALNEGKTNIMISGQYSDGRPLTVGARDDVISSYIGQMMRNNQATFAWPCRACGQQGLAKNTLHELG